MLTNDDMQRLDVVAASTREAVAEALGGAASVALLDFPSHMNVGDSMIWAGELRIFAELGVSIDYVCDIDRYNPDSLRRAVPSGPIALHGGGNFGDLWPEFQRFRLQVMRDFPERRIIQLPQSVLFRGGDLVKATAEAVRQHPDFWLMCRDGGSLKRARELLPGVHALLVPDAAYNWRPKRRAKGPQRPLVLLREDHEAQDGANRLGEYCREVIPSARFVDWGLTGWSRALWKLVRIPGRLVRVAPALHRLPFTTWILMAGYRAMAALNLRAGVRMFSKSSYVVTDRLHAHVLATLLGIPHVVLDNSYGKIGTVSEGKSREISIVSYADNADEAIERVKALSVS
ncbi:polysaccharide pyruvyl transferase family protein [uncultured Aeromicrobium sp.]|uniref:polysaccharide pyruvyl transferase family protein n=1 Tax=uncultured Aeromicrobium sp. TaxID=337820 RepID=UPI0025D651AA|nr:polysaccharide pyruvyl transferase family protein [uncultured Aeromicrobium sp.]